MKKNFLRLIIKTIIETIIVLGIFMGMAYLIAGLCALMENPIIMFLFILFDLFLIIKELIK